MQRNELLAVASTDLGLVWKVGLPELHDGDDGAQVPEDGLPKSVFPLTLLCSCILGLGTRVYTLLLHTPSFGINRSNNCEKNVYEMLPEPVKKWVKNALRGQNQYKKTS